MKTQLENQVRDALGILLQHPQLLEQVVNLILNAAEQSEALDKNIISTALRCSEMDVNNPFERINLVALLSTIQTMNRMKEGK